MHRLDYLKGEAESRFVRSQVIGSEQSVRARIIGAHPLNGLAVLSIQHQRLK